MTLSSEQWLVGPAVIDAWLLNTSTILRTISILFLSLALYHQILYRSEFVGFGTTDSQSPTFHHSQSPTQLSPNPLSILTQRHAYSVQGLNESSESPSRPLFLSPEDEEVLEEVVTEDARLLQASVEEERFNESELIPGSRVINFTKVVTDLQNKFLGYPSFFIILALIRIIILISQT